MNFNNGLGGYFVAERPRQSFNDILKYGEQECTESHDEFCKRIMVPLNELARDTKLLAERFDKMTEESAEERALAISRMDAVVCNLRGKAGEVAKELNSERDRNAEERENSFGYISGSIDLVSGRSKITMQRDCTAERVAAEREYNERFTDIERLREKNREFYKEIHDLAMKIESQAKDLKAIDANVKGPPSSPQSARSNFDSHENFNATVPLPAMVVEEALRKSLPNVIQFRKYVEEVEPHERILVRKAKSLCSLNCHSAYMGYVHYGNGGSGLFPDKLPENSYDLNFDQTVYLTAVERQNALIRS